MSAGGNREELVEALRAAGRRAFGETADPSAYVARRASDQALTSLRTALDAAADPARVVALVGTPGIGKTLLLRVLEARFQADQLGPVGSGPVRSIYLPYAGLEPIELAQWACGLMRRPPQPIATETEAIEALAALGGVAGRPVVLLIDDADSMPAATAEALAVALPACAARLRVLLALNPDSKGSRLLASLHALSPVEVRYRDRMSLDETRNYLQARMRWAGLPSRVIERFDERESHRIHNLANGLPLALHRIAGERFESLIGAREELAGKRQREDWMGRPIEDELEV